LWRCRTFTRNDPGIGQSSKELPMIGKVNNLRELFEIELKYAYDCEQKLAKKGIPTMIEKAGSPELKTALEHHLSETQNHIARLEQVFAAIGKEPDTKTNDIPTKLSVPRKTPSLTSTIRHFATLRSSPMAIRSNITRSLPTALSQPSRGISDCKVLSRLWKRRSRRRRLRMPS
jgi:hypothetical protein